MKLKIPAQLQKKLGPLPIWAWILVLIAGIAFARWLRSRGADEEVISEEEAVELGYGVAGDVRGTGSAGISGSGSELREATGTPVVSELSEDDRGLLEAARDFFNSPLPVLTDAVTDEPITITAADTGTGAAAINRTFRWGGKTWSPSDREAFKRHLTSKGNSYAQWVRNHPGAAQRVFGDTPATVPMLGTGARKPTPKRAAATPKKQQAKNVGRGRSTGAPRQLAQASPAPVRRPTVTVKAAPQPAPKRKPAPATIPARKKREAARNGGGSVRAL